MKADWRSGGRTVCVLALATALAALPLVAQQPTPLAPTPARVPDSVIVTRDTARGADSVVAQRGDSVRPVSPITPTGAFFRSLLLPGWGQARLGRNVTGGLFVAFEGLAAAMVWKSYWQLDIARTRGKYVRSHRQEREDWLVLLGFNHLLSGAEAYVSAHLFDFPAALKIQALPGGGGGVGVGVQIPLR